MTRAAEPHRSYEPPLLRSASGRPAHVEPTPREGGRSEPLGPPPVGPSLAPEVAFERNRRLRCALTRKPLTDPVVAGGFTYERRAIIAHLVHPRSGSRDPVTGAPLLAHELIRDPLLREALRNDRPRKHIEKDCPISLLPMKDPVIASDLRTYELSSLAKAYDRDDRSPVTRAPLAAAVWRHQLLRARNHLDLSHEPRVVLPAPSLDHEIREARQEVEARERELRRATNAVDRALAGLSLTAARSLLLGREARRAP